MVSLNNVTLHIDQNILGGLYCYLNFSDTLYITNLVGKVKRLATIYNDIVMYESSTEFQRSKNNN